jgi:uncharacterized coiled-coil DUF342 family protein
MNRAWGVINFVGVLALMVLCCVQWQANREVQLRLMAVETDRGQWVEKVKEEERTLAGTVADLNEFRGRLADAEKDGETLKGTLAGTVADRDQARAQRDAYLASAIALEKALDQWKAAVAAWEEALRQANAAVQKLAGDRNEAVTKLNDLVATSNGEIKAANEQLQKLAADRNEAVSRFNDLAKKYNALVQERNAATKP